MWTAGVGVALASMQVAAQTATCTILATAMLFGTYDPASLTGLGPVTSTITATCSVPPGSGNVPGFTMTLSLSAGSSGTYSERHMTSSPALDTVRYNIYTTASPTANTIWGDGTGGSVTVSRTLARLTPGQSGTTSALAYGFVPGGQDVASADYADTIVVIANW